MIEIVNRLQSTPCNRNLTLLTGFSTLMTVFFFFIMRPVELELTANTPYGVLDLEFAWTVSRVKTIFSAWGDELISKVLSVTFLDFGFLVFYSLSLSSITLLLTRRGTFGGLTNWGYSMTFLPIVAAIFDGIENINLILMLTSSRDFPSFAPFLASISAVLKFSLIITTFFSWIIGFVYSLIKIMPGRKSN